MRVFERHVLGVESLVDQRAASFYETQCHGKSRVGAGGASLCDPCEGLNFGTPRITRGVPNVSTIGATGPAPGTPWHPMSCS